MDKLSLNVYGTRLRMSVCFCSSEDDAYPCSNLQTQIRSANGWQSNKHCEYPQELGFFFDGQVNLSVIRILSHESKISSCVDVCVADATPEEIQNGTCAPYEEAVFTRLGHVRFSPNEKFNARELKTVGIRKTCVYLKLLFSRPFTNSYNLFNQVGMIGIAAHGNALRNVRVGSSSGMEIPVAAVSEVGLDEMLPAVYDLNIGLPPPDSNFSVSNTEILGRLKELDRLKLKAVSEEDYDLAAALKSQIEDVKKAGAEIDELEKAKTAALQEENFSEAKKIKQQLDGLRKVVYHLPSCSPHPSTVSSVSSTLNSPLSPFTSGAVPPRAQRPKGSRVSFKPLPVDVDKVTAVGKGFYDLSDTSGGIVDTQQDSGGGTIVPLEGSGMDWEQVVNRAIFKASGNQAAPKALSEDLSESKTYVSELGIYAVSCLFSRSGLFRDAAIQGIFTDSSLETLHQHSETYVMTILDYLVTNNHGISDPVAAVVMASCDAVKMILKEYVPGASVSKLTAYFDKLLQQCVDRLGDSNARVRESVEAVILAFSYSSYGVDRVITTLMKGFGGNMKRPRGSTRYHVSRIDLLTSLVDKYGVGDGCPFSILDLFEYVLDEGLQHSNREVRDAAIRLAGKLMSLDRGQCLSLLKKAKPAQLALIEDEARNYADRFSDNSLQEKDYYSQPTPHSTSESPTRRGQKPKETKDKSPPSSRKTQGSKEGNDRQMEEQMMPATYARSCQFCKEYNESFTDKNLDLHYIQSCPMLCPCPLCDQVTEIATLQEHLVTECDGREAVRECPRCKEAVRVEDLRLHIEDGGCIEYVPSHSVCPLCHDRFKAGMEGWRMHLARPPGCVNNPRKYDGSGPIS